MQLIPIFLLAAVAAAIPIPLDDPNYTTAAPRPLATASAVTDDACEKASSASVEYLKASPTATLARIPADLAKNCLLSVPLDYEGDLKLLDEYRLYLEFQSNTGWLAKPPSGYNEPRTDVLAGLQKIKDNLLADKYKGEWDFQTDLKDMIFTAYDNHFMWNPDIHNVFQFSRNTASKKTRIVSVSLDGKQLPDIYLYNDIIEKVTNPSKIVEIDGTEVNEYLEEYAATEVQFHDKDARLNGLYQSHSGLGFDTATNQFGFSSNLLNPTTTVKFENGSTANWDTFATVLKNLTDITDGQSFFDTFCTGPKDGKFVETPSLAPTIEPEGVLFEIHPETGLLRRRSEKEPVAEGYPTPLAIHSSKSVASYLLNGTDYNDTAVLVVPSFSPPVEAQEEFRDIVRDLFDTAIAEKKTKLIIDIRGNGGGNPFLGTDIWKRLYPDAGEPYDATRYKASDAFQSMGLVATAYLKNKTKEEAIADLHKENHGSVLAGAWASYWNYQQPWTTKDNEYFKSWDDYYGPYERNGDKYSAINRIDIHSPLTVNAPNITGYGIYKSDLGPAPFKPENIVLLNDGQCTSACAAFSELMKTQGKAQVITMGGGRHTGPMQAIGGTKGGWVHALEYYQSYAMALIKIAKGLPADATKKINMSPLTRLANATQPLIRSWSTEANGSGSRINLQDSMRKGDASETPLEFIYEAADCRLFYTPGMIRDVTEVWKAVRDAKWKDQYKTCVEGSTGHPSSESGGAKINNGETTPGQPGIPPFHGTGNSTNGQPGKNAASTGKTISSVTVAFAALFAASILL